ncbi:hypothetical protein UFOVP275_9 [uncultured Caudovirales phage]|uniref:Uncharacterized protein n=1 Tax=uncultured Caudovirales phage TaxID=2100421 RepID=A0A6J5LKL9_9CAUD|nr:hypothetical protein UFOVP275_9 [uncultured Caudovirales phage]
MKLPNDYAHCEGVVLQRGNNHPCARRADCLRYTEHIRKRGAPEGGWITYMAATDDCQEKIEAKIYAV